MFILKMGIISLLVFASGVSNAMDTQSKIVVDFSMAEEWEQWGIVNDGVMGGISQSQFTITPDKTAIFQGKVSLENYGGFASVRREPKIYQLADFTGLIIRVKGDGKRYQLRLRTDNRFDGIAYRSDFNTQTNTWITVRVPFSEFIPTFRGRVLTDAPPLTPDQIRQIGFLIADKQEGPFRLEIDWIQAYKTE